MNLLSLIVLVLTVSAAVGVVRVVVRGQARSRAMNAAIVEYAAVTGDYPSVEDWRSGRVAAVLEDTQELDPVAGLIGDGPGEPVVVRVRVVGDTPRELPGGGR